MFGWIDNQDATDAERVGIAGAIGCNGRPSRDRGKDGGQDCG
jgi:hypothetical protein